MGHLELMHDCPCGYDTRAYDEHCRGRYYGQGVKTAGILTAEGFPALMGRVKNGKRDAKYAARVGAFCEEFDWVSWVPDIHDINHSKEVRCGGPMRGAYNDSLEKMVAEYGYDGAIRAPEPPKCHNHHRRNFGIFVPEPGRVSQDRKLVGYIGMLRLGNSASYTTILGHGDYLKHGIMFALHFYVAERVIAEYPDVGVLYYLTFYPPSLAVWKRKAGFQEVELT